MGRTRIQELIIELAGKRTESSRPPNMRARLTKFVAKINQSSAVVYPDEIEVLEEICRLIDDESNGDLAWEKVQNVELSGVYNQPPELDSLTLAVGHSVLNSTVAYINIKSREIASGVLIDIENRIFLATAAHALPQNPIGNLSFVGNKSTRLDENIPSILSFGKEEQHKLRDVGFVELEPAFIETNCGKSPIPLSRIYPCQTGHESHWTCVGGYPGDEVRNIDDNMKRTRTKLFTMQCWSNKILAPSQWGVLEGKASREPDERLDVFIPYPREEDFKSLGPLEHQKPNHLCKPFGMSGGGYWQPNSSLKRSIFTPDYYSLIAIQSHWWIPERYLQATQIIHWLRLLWKCQPKLREILEDAFADHDMAE